MLAQHLTTSSLALQMESLGLERQDSRGAIANKNVNWCVRCCILCCKMEMVEAALVGCDPRIDYRFWVTYIISLLIVRYGKSS